MNRLLAVSLLLGATFAHPQQQQQPEPACLVAAAPAPDTTVYTRVDVAPRPADYTRSSLEALSQPPAFAMGRYSSTEDVMIRWIVETTGVGNARSIELRQSGRGYGRQFTDVARANMSHWRFCPAIKDGRAVRAWYTWRVHLVHGRP